MQRAAFRRATPVLAVADYPRARDHYRDCLGFTVLEEGGDPPRFGILERGGAVVFLDAWHGPPAAPGAGWSAYFHVDDVLALQAELEAAGANVVAGPRVTVYGMRELEVLDPDGHRLCFGADAD